MLGIGVRRAVSKYGGDYIFTDVRDKLHADIIFGNLEGVLSDYGYEELAFQKAQLRADPNMVKTLKNIGFNILNVANNHMMQHGRESFFETCILLERSGIGVVGLKGIDGWNCRPYVLQLKGIKIGFLGYSDPDGYGHEPLYAINEPQAVFADVRQLRLEVDYLVVSLHWGDEFICSPSPKNEVFGRKLIETGVDIILGHHPHSIQRIDNYRDKWICYSLGNFVFDMIWNYRTKAGLMTTFKLTKDICYLKEIEYVNIDVKYKPRSLAVDMEFLNKYVKNDEDYIKTEKLYIKLVRKRFTENRNLGHLYLLMNFYRYNPWLYFQIWLNSIRSLFAVAINKNINATKQ